MTTATQIQSLYPLTSSQREIWFDQLLHAEVPLYNVGGYIRIEGPLDPRRFEQAANLLAQKHDTLRTRLTQTRDPDGIPLQTYVPTVSVTVPLHDFTGAANPHEAALAWMPQQFEQPFELYDSPLFRYDLLKLREDCYYWLVQYHHLIVDGWAIALLVRSQAELYNQLSAGQTPVLTAYSYCDYIDSDRAYLNNSSLYEKQRQYWLGKYLSLPEPLRTPAIPSCGDRPSPG